MTTERNSLFTAALELPSDDRVELAERLWESLDDRPADKIENAWAEEIERRISDIDAGITKAVPWEEARRLMREGVDDEAD